MALLRPGAVADLAGLGGRDAQLGGGTARRFFQRDFEVVAQVGTTERRIGPLLAAATTAKDFAEDVAKGVAEIAAREAAEAAPAAACGSTPAWPYWSWARASLASERSVGGFLRLLEAFLGPLSPGLRSGWNFIASLR